MAAAKGGSKSIAEDDDLDGGLFKGTKRRKQLAEKDESAGTKEKKKKRKMKAAAYEDELLY